MPADTDQAEPGKPQTLDMDLGRSKWIYCPYSTQKSVLPIFGDVKQQHLVASVYCGNVRNSCNSRALQLRHLMISMVSQLGCDHFF